MTENKRIKIKKMSGDKHFFDPLKLRKSLQRSGAQKLLVDEVVDEITGELYDGISTREIYRKAFGKLKRKSHSCAARYKLKKAILELGPTGFPFETYVGHLFQEMGYKVEVGVMLEGRCVTHEVDVLATKNKTKVLVECKFHNLQSKNNDVKVPLYIKSRFIDIAERWEQNKKDGDKTIEGWIITNTRFSDDAMQYGGCAGLNLLGWDYPLNNGLKNQIDHLGLYPITCLNSITKKEKQILLDQGLVLCRELRNDPKLLEQIGVKVNRMRNILKELNDLLLCN